jgi:hypothetical protein
VGSGTPPAPVASVKTPALALVSGQGT